MSKKTKIFIIIFVIVILIITVIYFFNRKKEEIKSTESGTNNKAGNDNIITSYASDSFPLVMGAKGQNVQRLQFALNRIKPDMNIAEDGILGNTTKTKLLLTVPTNLSVLPMTEKNYTDILILSRKATA